MIRSICKNCKFYEEIGDEGVCYRFPPVFVGRASPGEVAKEGQCVEWLHPVVAMGDWCGEFVVAEDAVDE